MPEVVNAHLVHAMVRFSKPTFQLDVRSCFSVARINSSRSGVALDYTFQRKLALTSVRSKSNDAIFSVSLPSIFINQKCRINRIFPILFCKNCFFFHLFLLNTLNCHISHQNQSVHIKNRLWIVDGSCSTVGWTIHFLSVCFVPSVPLLYG